jgi:hypothetical protein
LFCWEDKSNVFPEIFYCRERKFIAAAGRRPQSSTSAAGDFRTASRLHCDYENTALQTDQTMNTIFIKLISDRAYHIAHRL